MSEPGVYDIDWRDAVERLTRAASTDEAWYAGLAEALLRPGAERAVDVGCGGGGMTLALARALGPGGEVVAVDGEQALLDAVRERLDEESTPLASVRLVRASLEDSAALARAGGDADLVWASAVVHHTPDQQATTDALAALLRPGGRLTLAEGGLSSSNLPWDLGVGSPGLEGRLIAAQEHWFAGMRGGLDGVRRMPYGWGNALRRAGLVDVSTRTTLFERPAPLATEDQEHVLAKLAHRFESLLDAELLDAEDLAAWDRLLDPGDECWLGNRDDLFVLEARSVHTGTRPHPK
ncbi:MAG: class I SAM-dependent methyltransferase [Streptosporangiales bacterium]